MGTDIFSYVETRQPDGSWAPYVPTDEWEPFEPRNYGVYGFLADVRNYSHSPVISEMRGLPSDVSAEVREHLEDLGWASWLTVAELQAYDYEQVFWDRRVTKRLPNGVLDGAALAEEGEGRHVKLRDFLGAGFFRDLDRLASLGNPERVRVVFSFD